VQELFVEETLRRAHVFDDDGLGHALELVSSARELLPV